ncbi:MAG: hypothetical protein Q8Q73_12505 [Stagnimonas sp.]|nr:hypothetical protein [Stagnimonas sp.]
MFRNHLRHIQCLLAFCALPILGFAAPVHAACLDEAVAIEVPQVGDKTKLPDGEQIAASAKSSVGLFEARVSVKSGVIAQASLTVNGKAPTSYEKLPSELQAVAKKDEQMCPEKLGTREQPLMSPGLAALAVNGIGSLLDFLLVPAEAAARLCTVKVVSSSTHCYGSNNCVHVIRVRNRDCSTSLYVI